MLVQSDIQVSYFELRECISWHRVYIIGRDNHTLAGICKVASDVGGLTGE